MPSGEANTSDSPSKKSGSPSTGETTDDQQQVVSSIPDLYLHDDCHKLVHNQTLSKEHKQRLWNDDVLPKIKEYANVSLYKDVCQATSRAVDSKLVAEMEKQNAETLAKLEKEITDAEQNLGETEFRNALQRKAEFQCKTGDKDAALSTFRQTFEKTVGIGNRLDMTFQQIRMGLFFNDEKLTADSLEKAKSLIEQGGDWDRKNRLKAYEALYKMSIRDFTGAADLFLDSVPTFDSPELMSYEQLVFYTVVVSCLALDRPTLRDKVMKGSEIQEQLTGGGKDKWLHLLKRYVQAFFECEYDTFFTALSELEPKLKYDRFFSAHYKYYIRAMRVKAYDQYLNPYKTVTIKNMANAFGVSETYIDKELPKLIAGGQLHYRIDAVNGIIETTFPDNKNNFYQTLIGEGDALGARIQRLATLINDQ